MAVEAQPTAAKKRRVSVCVGCGSQIHDQYIMRVAPDLEWHASCLKCADCEQYLDESCTCFVRDGKTYCKRDYTRLFGIKCDKCLQCFGRRDFVMRARNKVFHMNCFRCAVCNKQLLPGDEFALRDDEQIYCKADNEGHEHVIAPTCRDTCSPSSACSGSSSTNNNNSNITNNNSISINNNNTCSTKDAKDGDLKRGSHNENQRCLGGSNSNDVIGRSKLMKSKKGRSEQGGGKRPLHKGGDHKTTRVRTVLNEKQLHTLRTCYNANPRPDALMKEQLTEMTGLSPRVIRVWFQNKRCKDKKRSMMLKHLQQQHEKTGQLQRPLNGVPMVAASPVRHEGPPGLANPVEVQSYQTPWKALSDFAMQGDIDHQHPPFQQLMNTFEHMDPGCHGSPPHSDMMMQQGYHLTHDDMPNSVGSDFPGTPSELSSPLSQ